MRFLGLCLGPNRRLVGLGGRAKGGQLGVGRGAQRRLLGLERFDAGRQLVGKRRSRLELAVQLRAGLGCLLLIGFKQLEARGEIGDEVVALVEVEPQGVGGLDRVLPLAFETFQSFRELGDRLLPGFGLASKQAGHLQKLLPLGIKRVVAAAKLGELLVVAVQPGKRRRLRVGLSPLFGERLLETGDLLAEGFLQRGAFVVGFGKPAFQLGELIVGRELIGLRLARQFQVGQQPLALGIVCRFLLGLPGGGFNQRLFQPSRLGDVPKRDEHRRNRVGRARVGTGVQARRCDASR